VTRRKIDEGAHAIWFDSNQQLVAVGAARLELLDELGNAAARQARIDQSMAAIVITYHSAPVVARKSLIVKHPDCIHYFLVSNRLKTYDFNKMPIYGECLTKDGNEHNRRHTKNKRNCPVSIDQACLSDKTM
jgi:hypothetical protein